MEDKEKTAIERLKLASEMSLKLYKQPLIVTTSGGKDSSVCVELAQRAGIPFEVMHNHTTADAPETVYFVRSEFKRLDGLGIKCTINYPTYKGKRTSMWSLIPQKLMPPTRLVRYCCEVLKEHGGDHRFIVTGVRWAESVKRKNSRGVLEIVHKDKEKRLILENDNDERRQLFETCQFAQKRKRVCNPIIDWTDNDVWSYLRENRIPVNPLYGCGLSRVGCVGCPMAGNRRYQDFKRWPKYKEMYLMAFGRMLDERKRRGMALTWETARDVYHWWMEDNVLPGQMTFDKMEEI